VLAVVSMLDAIDQVPGLENRAGVKWVNDILVDGAKVGGVLAYTQSDGESTGEVVLGMGLNVETPPRVAATPFVPVAGSLRSATADPDVCTQRYLLEKLILALGRNYGALIKGEYHALLERYKGRSLVVGRDIVLCNEGSDMEVEVIAEGRVVALGDDLELLLEGSAEPFSKGRLMFSPG
jgi:BirA family biotin operon repressor/biotin-[acetyl-CoA-carboxylase] ligase